jgi:hypothetical protein
MLGCDSRERQSTVRRRLILRLAEFLRRHGDLDEEAFTRGYLKFKANLIGLAIAVL